MTTNELRHKYLEFFELKGHKIVPSDLLVPADDPTVLFTSAGMNQFKKQFLGQITDFRRASTCQKCLRTDDLDKVGKTASHHTFFEMLGNFSFGDYFKKEAISWAWEFMTVALKVPEDKLLVSVYKDDAEAYKIWKDIVKIPEAKIVKLGDHDNFWPADAIIEGPNGPCGPCSEIFYDWGKDAGCGKPDCSPVCSCGRFVEVWNLVFTQFNRKGQIGVRGDLEPLPNKNIDTGMGLERMASVLQGVKTNFEIDIFEPIIKEIVSGIKYQTSSRGAVNAVADHVRAVTFAISDGVMPSNEDRGYVIRKLIRLAYLRGKSLGHKKPFIYKIVPLVAEVMKEPYPELTSHRENISLIIKAEEERFCETLSEGERIIADRKELSAKDAFMLYDTHGYPLELLREKGVKFNEKEVNVMLEEQRAQSKKSSLLSGDVFGVAASSTDFKTEFLGHKQESSQALVLAVRQDKEGTAIILDKTPFYAECGGQIGDKGKIESGSAYAEVLDTKKINDTTVHLVKIIKGEFKTGDEVRAGIDKERRLDIARNHTATHLLQAALRKVLGEHVRQQGSLVSDEYLRFDFTHFKALTKEELLRVEELANEYIRNNDSVCKEELGLDAAKKSGALAFFTEKYSDKVRVISVADYSKEFCGGTHLDSTGQIGLFRVVSESSIASGIRRIEAITGRTAYKKMQEDVALIRDLSEMLKAQPENLKGEVENILEQNKELKKQISDYKISDFENTIPELLKKSIIIKNNINLIVLHLEFNNMQFLRQAADKLKDKIKGSYVVFLFYRDLSTGDYIFTFSISADLKDKGYDARQLISRFGLKGGGRPDLVQGGMKGRDWHSGQEELWQNQETIKTYLKNNL
ncbi:MAG: alanine--tRNA ligase [Candidatus Omnitrophota bacterium]|nr:alanine--tRNA ligase [Candidatus Omnitrophota bacterium]